MYKFLSELLSCIEYEIISLYENDFPNYGNVKISNLCFDSRNAQEDCLFFALPGIHSNGNSFIPEALSKGAAAVIFQGNLQENIKSEIKNTLNTLSTNKIHYPIFIKVKDSRFAMSPVSNTFYSSPSKKLAVIGVTGTEGKSSTVSFIWQLLRLCGKKAGFISTVEYSFGGNAAANPQHQTTPEAPIIHHHLNEMVKNGCEYAVIEASSHGLSKKTNRLGDVLFDCAVFMNVTLEHLEFHKTFEQYKSDKANLFRYLDRHNHIKMLSGVEKTINSIGIVNFEDTNAEYFINVLQKPVAAFFSHQKKSENLIKKQLCFLEISDISSQKENLSFKITPNCKNDIFKECINNSVNVKTKLSGEFNIYNVTAAITAVSITAQIPFEKTASFAADILPVKGRMTAIDMGQPFEVIVDYAHTPSSFETVFPPLRAGCSGKIIAVFGSGGERDLIKRPLQGEIAAKFCNIIILADEDPRGEDPIELLKMIAKGAEKYNKVMNEELFIIPDRKKAIRKAFEAAQKDDIVLLLGKAHENSIIYKDYAMPYDEISEAQSALSEMGYNS